MSDPQLEIFKQHRTSQDKYGYFLLAAVGAAIGFALNQTKESAITISQIPLGFSILLWGLSFFFGCRQLALVNTVLYANSQLIQVQSGIHPDAGRDLTMISAASSGIRKAIEDNSKWATRYLQWQLWSFFLGSISYIAWHIYEMSLR